MQVCLHFPLDSQKFMREYVGGSNRITPYFLGRTMADAPLSLLFLICPIIAYWLVGLRAEAEAFLLHCLSCIILVFSAQSLGYLSSAFSPNPNRCFSLCE